MIKGKTIVELKDVKTGIVDKIEDSNMVTNALNDIVNSLSYGWLVDKKIDSLDMIYPIVYKLLGGVVAFPSNIEENALNYYAPYNTDATCFASNVVNSGTETRRGSFNVNESGPVLDEFGKKIGYRFIWDFETSQANGDISCICLTHPRAGYNWYGCDDTDSTNLVTLADAVISSAGADYYGLGKYLNGEFYIDEEKCVYSIVKDDASFKIYKFSNTFTNKIGMFDKPKYKMNPDEFIESYEFLYKIPGTSTFLQNSESYMFTKLSEGMAIGISHSKNSLGSATVYWIKLNVKTGEYTEGTWTIEAKLRDAKGNVVVNGNYMYWIAANSMGIYKINIDNTTDVNIIQSYTELSDNIMMNTIPNGVIIGKNFYVANDTIHICKGYDDYRNGNPSIFMDNLMYEPSTYNKGSLTISTNRYILAPQYLATINNLSSPVIKTPDKTMKITYVITEE